MGYRSTRKSARATTKKEEASAYWVFRQDKATRDALRPQALLPDKVKPLGAPPWCDYVNYRATAPNKAPAEGINTACYSAIRPFHLWNIICLPRASHGPSEAKLPDGSPRLINPDQLQTFFQLAIQAGTIHPEVKPTWTPEGPSVTIPENPKDPNRTYIALCLYRWVDSSPLIPSLILHMHEKFKDREVRPHFLSLLQYVLALTSTLSLWSGGHTFLPTSIYSGVGPVYNPVIGIAARILLNRPLPDGDPGHYHNVDATIAGIVKDLVLTLPTKSPNYNPPQYPYNLEAPEDILHPTLAEVMGRENPPTKEELTKLLQKHAEPQEVGKEK